MSANDYPFRMIGRVPVVTAAAEIDITTSGQLWAILCQWRARGHTTVVMDLTSTVYCDMAGLHELVRAHHQAVADGGGLRLAIRADGAFARLLALSGLEDAIPHFATVEQALAHLPPAAIWPRRQDRAHEPGPHGPVRQLMSGSARARPSIAAAPRTGMGTDTILGLPVPPGRLRHREDLQPGRHVPHAHRR